RLDSGLIEPGVAGFGQSLNEIQGTAVAFFPVVKSDIANLDCRHAFEAIIGMNGAALECGDTYRDFECRSWRIRRTKCARQERNIRIVLQGFKLFRRDRRNKEVRVVSWPRRQPENVAVFRIDT